MSTTMAVPSPPLRDSLPGFAREVEQRLREVGRHDLAGQVTRLRITDRCRCGDEFCASLYTEARPAGGWRQLHETVPIGNGGHGLINVDAMMGRIVAIEVLFRPEVRRALEDLVP
jgi:hypothetical protein